MGTPIVPTYIMAQDAPVRLDHKALYAALNEQRCARRLTWNEVAKEARVNVSTITRTNYGGRLEINSTLAMVRWLSRTIECFVVVQNNNDAEAPLGVMKSRGKMIGQKRQ